MAEPVALLALAIEAGLGWPDRLYRRIGHPVGLFAAVIGACERHWNDPARSEGRRRLLGIVTLILLAVLVGGMTLLATSVARLALGGRAWIVLALLAAPGLAQRSLHDHVTPIARALAAGNLPAARIAVGRIVGRDTAALDEGGVARAAIESLAESFCDGIVAPACWLVAGGLPGLWIYKAVNTADSMIGHREPRWRAFGWAAARTDDLMNLLPACLSGALLCLAGGGWGTMLRDARRHASPNAGWPEAAMAGALGLRLAGPIAYDGVLHAKPFIGDGRTQPTAADVARALALYRRACLLLWALAGGAAWAL